MPVSATGLNASGLQSAVANTIISSAAYNANLLTLNGAVTPTFQTLGVAGASTLDNGALASDGTGVLTFSKALGGGNQAYATFAPSDLVGAAWNIDILSDEDWALVSTAIKLRVDRSTGVQFMATGGYLAGISRFTGTGNGTFSHGLGTTPNAFAFIDTSGGSQTFGVGTITSTTVVVQTGAGHAWTALAFLVN